jgi:SAM-dependent methyltransferase
MTATFDKYSRYYDLLYRDKDYAAEASFVAGLISQHSPRARKVLELGCGSGIHAQLLSEKGYSVHGVDRSEQMLAKAKTRAARTSSSPSQSTAQLEFSQGDIRTVRLKARFDAVISLFHVFSYQTSNQDLQSALVTAREHLATGGILIFDCWYGPAVLAQRPSVRIKRMQDENVQITRIAEPHLDPNESTVDICYTVFVRDIASGMVEEIREVHKMRYLFQREIELLATAAGMQVLQASEWMTGREPGEDTWGVCFVIKE